MVFSRNRSGQAPFVRFAALLVLAMSVILGLWRAADLLTTAPVAHRTPAEASLAALLDPVAGQGHSQVSIVDNPGGGRTILVLLDTGAKAEPAAIERLIAIAAGLDPSVADRVFVEHAEFVAGLPGRPDPAAWVELGLLCAICLLAGAIAVAPPPASAGETLSRAPSGGVRSSAPRPFREDEEPRPAVPAGLHPDVARLVRNDPARAASILRSWMHAGEADR